MEYITYKRFKGKGIGGNFNIPLGTVIHEYNGYLFAPDKRCICAVTSENGWNHFRQNTFEGARRQELLNKLYAYYESGKGNAQEVTKLITTETQNTYWKNLLRTLPTNGLEQYFREHIG